jgi:tyrosine-protein phosphatase SIW14
MSRQRIHSAAFFVTVLTLATAAFALASFFPTRSLASRLPASSLASSVPTRASVPEIDVSQDGTSQTSFAETGACAPLEADVTASNSAGSNADASANAGSNRVIPARQNFSGLQNFAQITPTLYRGGRPTEEGLACLQKMGVTIVISLEGKYKVLRKPVERLGMQYVSMFWECSFPRDEIFAKFLQLLRDNPGKKVFVYCHYGDDRTGMMIAAYRMAEQGWSAEEAKEEMKDFGFDFFHRRICTGLSDYEEHFPRHWREGHAFEKLRSTSPTQP